MSDRRHGVGHLTDERIQEWLDGQLSQREAARLQTHLDDCTRCRTEVEDWKGFVADLSALPVLTPEESFSGRVLAGLDPEIGKSRLTLGARAWFGRKFGADRNRAPSHPDSASLHDFLEGALGRRQSARVLRHLTACEPCRREAKAWREMFIDLAALPQLSPSADFASEVMARVRIPEPAPVQRALLQRALDRARSLAGPRRRRAWAAAAGMALTPMLTIWMVAFAVFSHPLATLSNLSAFVWLKGAALAGALGNSVVTGLMDNAAVFRTWTALGSLTSSPATASAALLVFSILTLAAAWVLYRNLFSASGEPAYVKTS